MLNSKDLSFVGYTYKNFDAVKGLKHSDQQRNQSLIRPSIGSIFGPADMDPSREPNGRDKHMHTVSSGDPMIQWPASRCSLENPELKLACDAWTMWLHPENLLVLGQVICPVNRWRAFCRNPTKLLVVKIVCWVLNKTARVPRGACGLCCSVLGPSGNGQVGGSICTFGGWLPRLAELIAAFSCGSSWSADIFILWKQTNKASYAVVAVAGGVLMCVCISRNFP